MPILTLNIFLIHLIIISIIILFLLYNNKSHFTNPKTNTSSNMNDDRNIKCNDVITLWSWNNKYLQMSESDTISVSKMLVKSTDIIQEGDANELFIIENDNKGDIKYGDKISIKSNSLPYYISCDNSNNLLPNENKYYFTIMPDISFGIVVDDNKDINDNLHSHVNVKYGDKILIVNSEGNYLSMGDSIPFIAQSNNQKNSLWTITDQYGQGLSLDWAKHSKTSQSSTYLTHTSNLAIDGNYETYSHTLNDVNAWYELEFPIDIYITTIHLENLKTSNVDILNRLSDFDIYILSNDNHVIKSKHFDYAGQGVTWYDVNIVGKCVKIILNNQSYLHFSEINVFGNTNKNIKKYSADVGNNLELNNNIHINNNLSMIFTFNNTNMNLTYDIFNILYYNKKFVLNIMDQQIVIPYYSNTWDNYLITISGGINSYTGWQLSSFNEPPSHDPDLCCYYVNNNTNQYYKYNHHDHNDHNSTNKIDSIKSQQMSYLGVLTDDQTKPILNFYVNGSLINKTYLTKIPIFNQNQKYKNNNENVKNIKFYNYITNQISNPNVKNLKWHINNNNNPISIMKDYSICFWIYGIHANSNVLSGLINVNTLNGMLVVQDINTGINIMNNWNHIIITYVNNIINVYLNTNLLITSGTSTSTSTSNITLNSTNHIYNMTLYNYMITKNIMISDYNNNPNNKYIDILKKLWQINGCNNDISLAPDYKKWIDLMEHGQQKLVQEDMTEIRFTKYCN